MRIKQIVAICGTVALFGGLAATPAAASTSADAAVDSVPGNVRTIDDRNGGDSADSDEMPSNPTQKLPDAVSAAVPDDATVVAPDLATKTDGTTVDLRTGAKVTDSKVVGTKDQQPDPLVKTDGKRFIPVEAGEVKKAVRSNGGDADAQAPSQSQQPQPRQGSGAPGQDPQTGNDADSDSTNSQQSNTDSSNPADSRSASSVRSATLTSRASSRPSVRNTALQNNQYGAYWGSYGGTPAFFEAGGKLFAQQAKGVIDVSEHQGVINWQAVKNAGVDGAIIRIAYGWDNDFDAQALRNIRECKRLGIPFGIYLYSYAYDNAGAAEEGRDVVRKLGQAGVQEKDLSYPVFYDLEDWTWTGHTPPTNPSVYDGIVNSWYSQLQAGGYNNLSVYSYTYYLNTALNSNNIHAKTRWVASYGARTGFGYSTNERGWQYADNGNISGISGHVDLDVFGTKNAANEVAVYRAYNPNSGEHFFTASEYEYRRLVGIGWNAEGTAWCAPLQGASVYRLYNLAEGQHLYTVNSNEYNVLPRYGWRQEGTSWFSGGVVPIYRVYNPRSGEHLFTADSNERDHLSRLGWRYEGVAWMGLHR